jgi:hypothetical protein
LYPSIIMAFNIDSSTQIGKIIIDPIVTEHSSNIASVAKTYTDITGLKIKDMADMFVDSIQARDFISTGQKWFNLPSIEELSMEVL